MQIYETRRVKEAAETLARQIREIASQRNMVEAEISDLEREHNDIIHAMENNECLYQERARMATRLARLRRERRKLKDWLHANKKYFDYIGQDEGQKLQKVLANLVSIGRKVEAAPGKHQGVVR